jgi:hypothetical protein
MMLSVSCSYYLVVGPLFLLLAPSTELYYPTPKKLVHVFPLFFFKVILGQNFVSIFEIVPREHYTRKALLSRE